MNDKKKILITGAKGFVGSYLCRKISLDPHFELMCIDIDEYDLTKWNSLSTIAKFDIVIHLAALSFVPISYKNPRTFYRTNFLSTLYVLELCKKFEAKIIYASSYVYGHPQYLPIDEEHPVEAYNPYSETKLLGERLCKAYHRDFGVRYAIVRPSNIYGKGLNEKFLIPTIIRQLKDGVIRLKTSKPKRDFVYIDDIVEAYYKLCGLNFDALTLNIGSGVSYSVDEIVSIILSLSDKNIPVFYEDELRKNEVLEVVYNIKKAKKILNWEPKTSLEEGLNKLL